MPTFATWNVNSLRVRLPHVCRWLQTYQPDVLALQETKLPDAHFPHAALQAIGYHAVYSGQATYNGMAILTRNQPTALKLELDGLSDDPLHRRAIEIDFDGIKVVNVYVPNGESILSEKYQFKLNWLARLREYLAELNKTMQPIIVMGDFNIAPSDQDVHNPKRLVGQVLVSAKERTALQEILDLGFIDVFRHLHPEAKEYSWWDYRAGAWPRNQGLRIDLILMNQQGLAHCQKCMIDRDPRGWERPSDHTPVILQLG